MSTSALNVATPRPRETGYPGWGLMAFFAVGIGIMAIAPYLTFNPADFNGPIERFQSEPATLAFPRWLFCGCGQD